jgi:hypothetical protein
LITLRECTAFFGLSVRCAKQRTLLTLLTLLWPHCGPK